MLYNKLAKETRIDVALNHNEVLCPTSEFFAFVLFGLIYRISFCCK